MSKPTQQHIQRTLHSRTEDSFGAWAPPVDIFEKQDHLVIQPRFGRSGERHGRSGSKTGVLTLQGERKQETEIREETHTGGEDIRDVHAELLAPHDVDALEGDGDLQGRSPRVTVPKAESRSQEVEIKVA